MKFTITKEKFLEGLQQVQHVVSSRTTLPILSNVLIEADSGRLRLTTTDLDVGVTGVVEANVERAGSITLPARTLFSIVSKLPAQEVKVDVDLSDHQAKLVCGPSRYTIKGLDAGEFPGLPKLDEAKEFELPQAVLKDALKKTHYAISNDETRYVLNGVFASFREGKLTLVATDGRRLAMVEHEFEFPGSQETDEIIPTKAVIELQRLLGESGEVLIRIGTSQVAFEVGSTMLTSKLIEGNYPNYKQVIPGPATERISLSREDFLSSVTRVSLLSTDTSNSVKLTFSENNIDIMSNSPDVGRAEESVPVMYTGKEFSIAFNPEFLLAPLKNLTDDTIHLDLIDEMSPGVLRLDSSFLYVLMPMRVSN